MIIYCYGHDFLCLFLTHYILIETCLNLMWCRNGMNIQYRCFFLLFRLLFLDLLRLRNASLEVGEIDHADVWHLAIVHIHDIAHVKATGIHGIKRLLHTIITDADIILNMYHLACNTFRSAAYITYVFVFGCLCCIIYCIFILIFSHRCTPFRSRILAGIACHITENALPVPESAFFLLPL